MDAQVVAPEVCAGAEGGRAEVAPEGATIPTPVHGQVTRQLLLGGEAHAAHRAHQPLLPRVDAQVPRQVRAVGEAARADVAPVRLLPRVAPHVLGHHVRVGRGVRAEAARVHPPAVTVPAEDEGRPAAVSAALGGTWLARMRSRRGIGLLSGVVVVVGEFSLDSEWGLTGRRKG